MTGKEWERGTSALVDRPRILWAAPGGSTGTDNVTTPTSRKAEGEQAGGISAALYRGERNIALTQMSLLMMFNPHRLGTSTAFGGL